MARHSFPCSPSNRRALACAFAVGAIALAACGAAEHSSDANSRGGSANASGGSAGTAAAGGGSSGAGGAIIQISFGGRPDDRACSGDGNAGGGTAPLFCEQDVGSAALAARELYSWTTLEQAAELRAGSDLFTRSERPGMGPGYAFTYMMDVAANSQGDVATILNGVLTRFDKGRYAWPHPWATRMGWPGEDYGDQLLRIVLKPEAWVLIVWEESLYPAGGPRVVDMNNKEVPLADAAAALDRIGAIYFVKTDVVGRGTFSQCSGGYREFIVGNLAMIEEWSLGTQAIRARIEGDAALIDSLRREVEVAPPARPIDATTFNTIVACRWGSSAYGNVERYERALAIPSENYIPTLANLTSLRDTLQASVFDPDPLVVKPGQ